jgi:signal transduction histidine kinase
MKSENQFPLPGKQYRGYVYFFHVLTLGALAIALAWTLSSARAALGWREAVVALLLLAQMGLYLALLVFSRQWPFSPQKLTVYFAASLGMWLVEYWLMPQVWWLNLAYLGQMFGLLPAKAGLAVVFLASLAFFARNEVWDLSPVDVAPVLGMFVQWLSSIGFFVFINQLVRTSQERGRLIAELEAAKEELQAAQQREAELAVLRERERLARDLHDSLGHTLVALSVQLEAIQRLYRVAPAQASAQVDEMKALARSSMAALRRSLAGLRAPGLGDSALRSALQALCVDFGQRTGVEIECHLDEVADDMSSALAEAIWRVAQEALANVEKHAHARKVQVSLAGEPGSIVLRVTDDGVGLPPGAESSPNRFGLRGMRERVEGLGGTLTLRSGESGASVEACLPIIAVSDQPMALGRGAPTES